MPGIFSVQQILRYMEQLFTGFATADAAAWKSRIEKDLKGITFEQLSVTDRNGLTVHPFYTTEDIAAGPLPLFHKPGWEICAAVEVGDSKAANRKALQELEGGASGLCFIINEAVDFDVLLQNVEIRYIYTHFLLSGNEQDFIVSFLRYLDDRGIKASELHCSIAFDPINAYLQIGEWIEEAPKAAFLSFAATAHDFNAVCVDATVYQNAGANTAYELACTLAQLNEYLHWLDEAGQIQTVDKVHIALATGTGFFEEIAKLRALQQLLPLLCQPYNISPALHLHVETSGTYRSRFDAYSNLLRDSLSGMAAVLGGCNSLLIRAFDENVTEVNNFSSRMSRNQQLIFRDESYLDKVADVAAGSYYLETLTREIAEQAWVQFQGIEQDGGLIASFDKGILKQQIETQAAQWIQEYKEGKRVLIGVNKYPNADDKPVAGTPPATDGPGIHYVKLTEHLV